LIFGIYQHGVHISLRACEQFSSHIVSASWPYRTDWLSRAHFSRHHRETNCSDNVLCMSLFAVPNLQINSHFYIAHCHLLPRSSWFVTLNRRVMSLPTLCNVSAGCGVIKLKNDQSINRSSYTSTNRTIGPTIHSQKYRMIQPPTSQTQRSTILTAEPNKVTTAVAFFDLYSGVSTEMQVVLIHGFRVFFQAAMDNSGKLLHYHLFPNSSLTVTKSFDGL